MAPPPNAPPPRTIVMALLLRILGAVAGTYALSAALVSVGALALVRAGMPRSEAVALCALLGFIVYLVLLLWGFSVRRVGRLWCALGGGAALLALLNRALG